MAELVAWGTVETIRNRIAEHHRAGADHVCIQVVTEDDARLPRDEWRTLAAALRPGVPFSNTEGTRLSCLRRPTSPAYSRIEVRSSTTGRSELTISRLGMGGSSGAAARLTPSARRRWGFQHYSMRAAKRSLMPRNLMSTPGDQSLDAATRLFAASPEPAFVVDLEGRIVYWNRAAAVFFGIPASEALGRPCAVVVRGLSAVGEIQCRRDCPLLARASQDDSYSVAEMQVPTMPRPARWSRKRVHHLPLEDDSGGAGYVLHVLTDVPDGPEDARSL